MSDMVLTRLMTALADRYRIDRELGQGGMATVYLAHDIKHDRDVAIKVLKPELGAVLGVERFLSEIKVTANLQHPNLLPLFESGGGGSRINRTRADETRFTSDRFLATALAYWSATRAAVNRCGIARGARCTFARPTASPQ